MKLPADVLARLELGLLIGTPGLAALTLGGRRPDRRAAAQRRPGGTADAAAGGAAADLRRRRCSTTAAGALQWLGAVSLLLVAGAPFVAGAAIRASRD